MSLPEKPDHTRTEKRRLSADRYQTQNTWISLLRIFMCLVVIQVHFGTTQTTIPQKFVGFFSSLAVPCFMFLSFFLMSNDLIRLNRHRIQARLSRLYVPVLFWSIVYFAAVNCGRMLPGRKESFIGFDRLLMNILFSHVPGLTTHLWFLVVQVFLLTGTVICFQFVNSKRGRILALISMAMFAFVLEYTGAAFYLFDTAPYESRYPLGRTIECIPYAAGAVLYSWCVHGQKAGKKISLWVLLMLFTILSKIFVPYLPGFGYNGVYLFFASASICVFALNLPDVFRGRCKTAMNWLGSCTMGIYCSHLLIGNTLNLLAPDQLDQGTLFFDVLIFLLGLFSTIVLRLLSKRIGWKWLSYVS